MTQEDIQAILEKQPRNSFLLDISVIDGLTRVQGSPNQRREQTQLYNLILSFQVTAYVFTEVVDFVCKEVEREKGELFAQKIRQHFKNYFIICTKNNNPAKSGYPPLINLIQKGLVTMIIMNEPANFPKEYDYLESAVSRNLQVLTPAQFLACFKFDEEEVEII